MNEMIQKGWDRMLRFGKIILTLVIVCSLALSCGKQNPQSGYALETKDGVQLFTNYSEGYCISLDGEYVVDQFYEDVGVVLCSEDTQIEIYKQVLNASESEEVYTQYSNGFLNNRVDHNLLFSDYQMVGKDRVYVTAWFRDKLQKVDNDKNYYATFDVIRSDAVYSIYIKTAVPFENVEQFYDLVKSLRVFKSSDCPEAWSSKKEDVRQRGWNEETLAFYQAYLADDAQLSWGIFEPMTVCGDFEQIRYYQDVLDYQFSVALCYSHFRKNPDDWGPYLAPSELLEMHRQEGHVVELTLQTAATSDGGNMMYDILQGEYDAFLYDYAQSIADFGHPVLFRLNNEMNGDWCPYSGYNTSKDTMIYKEVYWYLYGIFEETGANENTIWIWNPNCGSFPNFNWNHSLMYYPGDAYVDVVGMTAYNTGTYYAQYGERWQEFAELYADLYEEYCRLFEQPLMITEFSCASMGGDKNAWVERMFSEITEYGRIKIAVWWDGEDYDTDGTVSRSYLLDESPELLEIFRRNLA